MPSEKTSFWTKAPNEPTLGGLFEIVSYDHKRGFGFVRTIGEIASYIHTGEISGDVQLLRKVVKLANIQHIQPGDIIEAEIDAAGPRPRISEIISYEPGPNSATDVITVRVKTYSAEKGWGFLRGVQGDIFFRRAAIERPLEEKQIVAGLYVSAGIMHNERGWRAVWIGEDQKKSLARSEKESPKDDPVNRTSKNPTLISSASFIPSPTAASI